MIARILAVLTRLVLSLRYRVRVRGMEQIADAGDPRPILFLPNHPALIDPVIVMAHLYNRFGAKALADKDQIDRFFIRWMAARAGVLPIPDMARHGAKSRRAIERALEVLTQHLRKGESALLYPGGHLKRRRLEDMGGNSAVEQLLRAVPNVRIVLVRTRGLWGSGFSWASGNPPNVPRVLRTGAVSLLLSGVFFAPRRQVTIELSEPADFPRDADRTVINRYLERFYNEDPPASTYVPRTIWERGGVRELPEVEPPPGEGEVGEIPPATRETVTAFLRELTGIDEIDDSDELARDLGLDSLARSELLLFLTREFGFPQANVDSLRVLRLSFDNLQNNVLVTNQEVIIWGRV